MTATRDDQPATITVQPPAPAHAVLRCACGRMVDSTDLRWIRSRFHDAGRRRAGIPIPQVGCPDCAKAARR